MANDAGGRIDHASVLKVTVNLSRVDEAFRRAMERALYQEGERIIAASKERVPVDLGTLKNSGYVAPPEWLSATHLRCELGYGGAAAAYAAAVHEHVSGGGSPYDPPSWVIAESSGSGVHFTTGGPKYLESVINERSASFMETIATAIANDLGTGGR